MIKLNNFLRVWDAAEYLGVSPNTLRNWENASKIVLHRHPVNGYRLFKQEELDDLLTATNHPSGDVKIENLAFGVVPETSVSSGLKQER